MKRFIVLTLATSLLAETGVAAVAGTAHDIQAGNDLGACSACHLPHQAQGEKLWSKEPVTEGMAGATSALCASCHHSGGAYGALMTRAHSDDHVYAAQSHGQKLSLLGPPPATDTVGSGLPNVDAAHAVFDCTTCHSVHDDTYRPFLTAPINVLCARCHRLRHYVAGVEKSGPGAEAGTWGLPQRLGPANPGAHPVGDDVTGGRAGGPVADLPVTFRMPTSSEPGKWSLGGHLTKGSSGGVTCVTCHAVHGTEADTDDPAASGVATPPGPGFLTVRQATQNLATYSRAVPNGMGATSTLCESCHGVGNDPTKAPGGQAWISPVGQHVNPGRAATYSHPVDSYPSGVDAQVVAFPKEWPVGDITLAGRNVSPVPICETCHAPHPAAELSAGRPDVREGASASLLRAPLTGRSGERLCDTCHRQAIAGHHPLAKPYDSQGVPYLASARGGSGDTLLCSTCHSSAHNWTQPSWAGLDSGWLPSDNGRSSDQADDMYDPNLSKTCMDCHYFMDGDGISVSPTMGAKQTVITTSDDEYPAYQASNNSQGTHYIGLVHDRGEWQLAPLVNVFDTSRTWAAQQTSGIYAKGLAPGWSRFGGENSDGARVLVCESCHELEPDKNGGFRHLLLAPYAEGKNGIDEYAGDLDGRDILCEACHGVPKGSHPMSGMIVSRSEATLNTNAEWLRPDILGYATMNRAVHALSCDSCHQPHDANTLSYTFILDAPLEGTIGNYTPPIRAGVVDAAAPSELSSHGYLVAGEGKQGTYATPTLQGTGGSHAGLCSQCHFK